MQPPNQSPATVLQAIDDINFPQRLAAIEQSAENAPGQGLQFRLSTGRVDGHSENVAADVKVGIVLPSGQADVQRRHHHHLLIARNPMQLGGDARDELVERYGAVKNDNARNS